MTIPFAIAENLGELTGLRHGFFGRQGGVSRGIFDSLNCSAFSGDDASAIQKNRDLVAAALHARSMITNKQVHGSLVRVIDQDHDLSSVHEADGLVTTGSGIALAALGADCAPVLFADPVARVIGVAHAGWQGALGGVTDSVINTMCDVGAQIGNIVVAIGPAIQKQSYEVGEQFKEKVMDQSPIDADNCFHCHGKTGNVHFDLPGYTAQRLKVAGIRLVTQLADDTYTEAVRYFSYRRSCHRQEDGYGRQVGAICLEE